MEIFIGAIGTASRPIAAIHATAAVILSAAISRVIRAAAAAIAAEEVGAAVTRAMMRAVQDAAAAVAGAMMPDRWCRHRQEAR